MMVLTNANFCFSYHDQVLDFKIITRLASIWYSDKILLPTVYFKSQIW